MKNNAVLVIAGPTACGKSKLALDVAKSENGTIINGDSMQVYRDIPIIAAAPSREDKNTVEHCLYEIYDCDTRGNVVDWLNLCSEQIKRLWQEKKLPIVVGGTGFYLEALINGVTPIPEVSLKVRRDVEMRLKKYGLPELYAYLQKIDSEMAHKLNRNDTTRIRRAVEIFESTGKKTSEWYKVPLIKRLPQADFTVVKLIPELAEIEQKCCERLDDMVYKLGALKEIEVLVKKNIPSDLPAMKALGVPELSAFVRGETDLDSALQLAKLHTRQYAKRQRTWLKHKIPADLIFDKIYSGQSEYLEKIKIALNA